MEVSIWWVVFGAFLGGTVGFMVAAIFAMSGGDEDRDV